MYSVDSSEVLSTFFFLYSLTFPLINFQLLSDATAEEEVQVLTGLGQTLLILGDITQATQVSVLCSWSFYQN